MPKKKKKNPEGRPTKYRLIYCQKILDYFEIDPSQFKDITITYKDGSTKECTEEEASPLPTFRKFARSVGTYHDVLLDWCKKFPEFSTAYNRAKEAQQEFIIENALRDNYSGYFAGLMMKNMFYWRDKQELEHSGSLKLELAQALDEAQSRLENYVRIPITTN
jgi:hypothetical protein